MSAIERLRRGAHLGDRAPFTCGMTNAKDFYSFEAQAGRACAVILTGRLPPSAAAPIVEAFQQRTADFDRLEADVVMLVDAQGPFARDYVAHPPRELRTVYCLPEVFYAWGFDSVAPLIVVMDRGLRVVALIESDSEQAIVDAALSRIAAAPSETSRDILLPAPVLLLPNILSGGLCRELIDHFEGSAHTVGGMAGLDASGAETHKIDETKKKRRDCVLPPDHSLGERVVDALCRICLPEMKRAFQCNISYVDRIVIARYDDTGGYFLRHRDNAGPSVAYRQFALSINLNFEEYEGGYLVFPEYNSHRYKPRRGAGIMFSASLLHEATPVVKGRRYVLLTFLHDAEGEAQRLAFLGEQPGRAVAQSGVGQSQSPMTPPHA